VYAENPHDEQALQERLGQAREGLDRLAGELNAIDGELEGLSAERQQFRLLDSVCDGLDELNELGAAGLFWDGRFANGEGQEHVRVVRSRLAAFQKRLDEIEARRQEVADEIAAVQQNAELLADDLYEIERAAELRKLEWIPDREVESLPIRYSRMPWARGGEEDRRFRRTLLASLLLSLLLGLLLPMIDLPLPEPWEAAEVPERLTRLIEEQRPLPPPPVVQETRPEETEPEPVEELAKEETEPSPTQEQTPEPRQKAASKGILAFREKFSSLAEDRPAARLGSQAKISRAGEAAVGRPSRSLVTAKQGTSGGINLASLSRDVGGGGGGLEGARGEGLRTAP
jgi:prefoldin subunit 5